MSAATDIPRTTEEWTYIGKRVSHAKGGKPYLVSTFLHDGRELHFRKLNAGQIGGRYAVEVTRGDDGAITVHGSPKWLGADAALSGELPDVVRWTAATRAAEVEVARHTLEGKMAKRDGLSDALDTLALGYASLRTRADRAAFIAYVEVELVSRKVPA